MKVGVVFIVLVAFLASAHLSAESSRFRVVDRSSASPDTYGKPQTSWPNSSTLVVQIVVYGGRGSVVDPESGDYRVQGQSIKLCYRMESVTRVSKNPTPTVAPAPQVIEFTIPGLSDKQHYDVAVGQTCY